MITFIRLFKLPLLTWRNMSKIVSKMTILWKILKISEMIQDDLRWIQGGSGSLPDHQSFTKKVSIWRLGDVQKTPPRSHMNPQNHSKIHKSPVLAHNIHKDCPLGVASISIMIWCEALSLMVVRLVVKIEGSVEIRSLEFCGGSFSASRANQHKVE